MLVEDQPAPVGGSGDVLHTMLDGGDIEAAVAAISEGAPFRACIDSPGKVGMLALVCAAGAAEGLGVDLRKAIAERRLIGIERYKQPLQIGDGRDHAVDALQELIDAAAYLLACDLAGFCGSVTEPEAEMATWAELEGDQQVPFVDAAEVVIQCVRHGDLNDAELDDAIASYLYRMAASASCGFTQAPADS